MLSYSYSEHPPKFLKSLRKTFGSFALHREKIKHFPFAHLPWFGIPHLNRITLGKKLTHMAICGIGGSSLGTKALTSALGIQNVFFIDNIDPDFVDSRLKEINFKKTLFLLISKSGETIEVLSLAKLLLQKSSSLNNFLVITDDPKSSLGRLARGFKIPIIRSPGNVPGRFSVLSVVGMFPAALTGARVHAIAKGARLASLPQAFRLACHQYHHFMQKRNIVVLFPYAERLANFAEWGIQLLAESIGKSRKIGITPTKALGVKDQHSQLQLFLDGPDDKFYIFIKPERSTNRKSPALQKLFDAEYQGVKKAFIKKKRPFCEISMPKINEETLGELFFAFELVVAFLGSLFGVNVENQPAVELSKIFTKAALK